MDGFSSEAFRSFAFYGAILVIKMLAMSPLTGFQRFKKKAFINPEDLPDQKKFKIVTNDEDVERVRRAHLNDLENVVPFLIIGLLYCFTNPTVATATLLCRIFTGARIGHTIVYAIYPVKQPARAIAWALGYMTTGFMAYKVLTHFW